MARQPIEEPTVTVSKLGGRDETEYAHPAYGQITLSRIHGHRVLYASDFVHHDSVRISIHESIFRRGLSQDWHFPKGQIVEIELSEAQWATFVSSFNMGSGVPCTLRYVRNDEKPEKPNLPEPDIRREYATEVRETLQDSIDHLKKLEKRIEELGAKLPNKTLSEMVGYIKMAKQEIEANLPFVAESFDKHVEDSVEKAKVDIHAYALNTVMRSGLQALQGAKLLEISDGTKRED